MVALVRSGELLELTKMVRDESAFSELFETF
jgi:hypothetical protein